MCINPGPPDNEMHRWRAPKSDKPLILTKSDLNTVLINTWVYHGEILGQLGVLLDDEEISSLSIEEMHQVSGTILAVNFVTSLTVFAFLVGLLCASFWEKFFAC